MKQNLNKKIVTDPNVMAGKPVIKGTRIPVDTIIRLLAKGMKTEEILEDYPNLKKEDIEAALEYCADVIKGEDIFPLDIKAKKHA